MAAGLGFKTFNTGDVLSAADTNGYLMQGIWVFANAAARDAAVTSPQEGNACYLKDIDVIQVYSGTAWVGQSASNPISGNIVDAKGDLIAATANDTVARLGVGSNGQVLTADSAEATGLKWVSPSSGGMTLLSTTTLSGATVTISSINQSYKTLVGYIFGVTNATADGQFNVNPNNASVCQLIGQRGTTASAQDALTNSALITNGAAPLRTSSNNAWTFIIDNYASTTAFKPTQWYGTYVVSGPATNINHYVGSTATTSAITSIQFSNSGGNLSTGTVLLYGVS